MASHGCPAACGPDWPPHVIAAARRAGPHTSALLPENLELVWEDILYQQQSGFVRIVPASELFTADAPSHLKISRVAVVPQVDRRGRIILNLSAGVSLAGPDDPRRSRGRTRARPAESPATWPSVNDTTDPAADQDSVQALGAVLPELLYFMYDTPHDWVIHWQKIDLSDGFWRMTVAPGDEYHFVFELPRRPGDTEPHFVLPSSLQMGWTNSPAYFCTATEACRQLVTRLLALTTGTGLPAPHPHEPFCLPSDRPAPPRPWATPGDVSIFLQIFVDDFLNGVAAPRDQRHARAAAEDWVSRCALHGIHALFPPPDVSGHDGGRDSISIKKLTKGDARWHLTKIMLGLDLHGADGPGRLIGLPLAKADRYIAAISAVLARPRNFVSLGEFQKLVGKIVHACIALPMMKGHMTPLNRVLSFAPPTVGLAKPSATRDALSAIIPLLRLAHFRPSHITELVPPHLPHYYGYVDASAMGAGGVWLPCTRWLPALVWRVEWPPDIAREVRRRNGTVTNSDVEAAAVFIAECDLEHRLADSPAGVSTHLGSDNTPTCGWYTRMASRAKSRPPELFLRWTALRQRWTRRGPADTTHIPGKTNLFGDIPSRSYDAFPNTAAGDSAFLSSFAHQFPLPPQLGSWTPAHVAPAIVSAAISLLRGQCDSTIHPATSGPNGASLPTALANTLSSLTARDPPSVWNEASISWPLLDPSGQVSTTVAAQLAARPSRQRFASAAAAYQVPDLQTLGATIQARLASTPNLPPSTGNTKPPTPLPGPSTLFRPPPCAGSPPPFATTPPPFSAPSPTS